MTFSEKVQPIPAQRPAERPYYFWFRCLVDLQLCTIVKYLRPVLKRVSGYVLDVGAGESPWRAWVPNTARYISLDVKFSNNFKMKGTNLDLIYYDGRKLPFGDSTFDFALCIEVLEHVEEPQVLILEVARVLKPQGTFILTVPWSARQHHLPYDFHRYTKVRLRSLLTGNGFEIIDFRSRGSEVAVIANKLIILTLCLLRSNRSNCFNFFWKYPLGLLCGVLAAMFVFAAHVSCVLGVDSKEDPLGFFVKATISK